MKRRLFSICLCLLLCAGFIVPVSAEEQKVIDYAGLLSASEIADLEKKAQQLVDDYRMDIVILTIDSLGGKTSESYADDFFDDNGYGIGDAHSGVILLLAMETREWAISTCGDTIYALTDYGIESVFAQIAGYLSKDRYYEAFDAYLDELQVYFQAYSDGEPIDGQIYQYTGPGTYEHGTQENVVHYSKRRTLSFGQIILSVAIGAGVAAVVVFIMRSQMNTVKQQHGAVSYLKQSSYELRRCQDFFLYSQISKVRRAESSGGSHSHGGGSSIHRSSGGSRHGGGHGRF